MELSDEARQDVMEFQDAQQQLQMILMQKQQMQMQTAEIARAKEEIAKSNGPFYRSIGTILVAKTKEELDKELAEESESIKMRTDLFAKQEERLKSKLNSIQEKLRKMESGPRTSSGGSGEGATITNKPKKSG